MDKTTFENLKKVLTSDLVYAADVRYSLSLYEICYEDFEYRSITVFSNRPDGSFHDGFARFFCEVAHVLGVACSFRSRLGVCVCRFY